MTPDFDEIAFWRFDARRKGYAEWKRMPQSERDAFKAEARIIAREARREALGEAVSVAEAYEPRCDLCPSGVSNAIRALIDKEPT